MSCIVWPCRVRRRRRRSAPANSARKRPEDCETIFLGGGRNGCFRYNTLGRSKKIQKKKKTK
jgi:hypothetical protein